MEIPSLFFWVHRVVSILQVLSVLSVVDPYFQDIFELQQTLWVVLHNRHHRCVAVVLEEFKPAVELLAISTVPTK